MLRVNTETDDDGAVIPPLIDNATGIPVPRTPDAAPSTPVRAPRHIDTDLDEQSDLHSPAASAIRVPSVRDPPPRALQLTATTHTLLLRITSITLLFKTPTTQEIYPNTVSSYHPHVTLRMVHQYLPSLAGLTVVVPSIIPMCVQTSGESHYHLCM